MKTLLILLTLLPAMSFAQTNIKKFEMEYEVITAQVVCWQTCRHSGCEESNFQPFFDTATFGTLQGLASQGKTWTWPGLRCGDEIDVVAEHMPNVQKEDPSLAAKILASQGSTVSIIVYDDVAKQADEFINQLKEDLKQDDRL